MLPLELRLQVPEAALVKVMHAPLPHQVAPGEIHEQLAPLCRAAYELYLELIRLKTWNLVCAPPVQLAEDHEQALQVQAVASLQLKPHPREVMQPAVRNPARLDQPPAPEVFGVRLQLGPVVNQEPKCRWQAPLQLTSIPRPIWDSSAA